MDGLILFEQKDLFCWGEKKKKISEVRLVQLSSCEMPSSQLVPSQVVACLYRRYLKAATKIPNATIRMLLLTQVRSGFRGQRLLTSAITQREIIEQAHKDLAILEDERHVRTLYINRFGNVSCMEWEMRKTEWHFTQKAQWFYTTFLSLGFAFFAYILINVRMVDDANPQIAKSVELMAAKMEVEDPRRLSELRARQVRNSLESKKRRDELELRILSTFQEVPEETSRDLQLPTLRNPNAAPYIRT